MAERFDEKNHQQSRSRDGLERRLFRSHLLVASISFVVMLMILGLNLWMRSKAIRLANQRGPTVQHATQTLRSVERSFAALREWMATGEKIASLQRQQIWETETWPNFRALEETVNGWAAEGAEQDRLVELQRILTDLEEEQWWIEETVHAAGNNEARTILDRDVLPVVDSVLAIVTAMIELEENLPEGGERKHLMSQLANLRSKVIRLSVFLTQFAETGEQSARLAMKRAWDDVEASCERIRAVNATLSAGQVEQMEYLERELRGLNMLVEALVTTRLLPNAIQSHYLLRTEVEPRNQAIRQILGELTQEQAHAMQNDAASVSRVGNASIGITAVLILCTLIGTTVVSRTVSRRMTRPISALEVAIAKLSHGALEADLDITGNDELSRLTESFNRMRRSLSEGERQLHEQVVRTEQIAERLRETNVDLSQFTYIASHDLQEPIRNLISYATLLKEDLGDDLPADAAEDLTFILSAAQRMKRLVLDLLAFSRSGRAALRRERVNLDECVDDALLQLASQITATEATIKRVPLPTIWGDQSSLVQVFQNLIGNALKYRSESSVVVSITLERRKGVCVLGIEDNGIGIKPDYLEQVFLPFKRLHGTEEYEGSGIGLAICRKTVERHGGELWVESNYGTGSHFRFTLPLHDTVEAGSAPTTLANTRSFVSGSR